jgi:hypothetical protein
VDGPSDPVHDTLDNPRLVLRIIMSGMLLIRDDRIIYSHSYAQVGDRLDYATIPRTD